MGNGVHVARHGIQHTNFWRCPRVFTPLGLNPLIPRILCGSLFFWGCPPNDAGGRVVLRGCCEREHHRESEPADGNQSQKVFGNGVRRPARHRAYDFFALPTRFTPLGLNPLIPRILCGSLFSGDKGLSPEWIESFQCLPCRAACPDPTFLNSDPSDPLWFALFQ